MRTCVGFRIPLICIVCTISQKVPPHAAVQHHAYFCIYWVCESVQREVIARNSHQQHAAWFKQTFFWYETGGGILWCSNCKFASKWNQFDLNLHDAGELRGSKYSKNFRNSSAAQSDPSWTNSPPFKILSSRLPMLRQPLQQISSKMRRKNTQIFP